MNSLNSEGVDRLLRNAEPGSTVYLVGAGGCGMSGLAHLLLDIGIRVAGSDLLLNEHIEQLRKRGAEGRCVTNSGTFFSLCWWF